MKDKSTFDIKSKQFTTIFTFPHDESPTTTINFKNLLTKGLLIQNKKDVRNYMNSLRTKCETDITFPLSNNIFVRLYIEQTCLLKYLKIRYRSP